MGCRGRGGPAGHRHEARIAIYNSQGSSHWLLPLLVGRPPAGRQQDTLTAIGAGPLSPVTRRGPGRTVPGEWSLAAARAVAPRLLATKATATWPAVAPDRRARRAVASGARAATIQGEGWLRAENTARLHHSEAWLRRCALSMKQQLELPDGLREGANRRRERSPRQVEGNDSSWSCRVVRCRASLAATWLSRGRRGHASPRLGKALSPRPGPRPRPGDTPPSWALQGLRKDFSHHGPAARRHGSSGPGFA